MLALASFKGEGRMENRASSKDKDEEIQCGDEREDSYPRKMRKWEEKEGQKGKKMVFSLKKDQNTLASLLGKV